jgi:sulfoxide reductase heme-binding subunit YedZ
VSTQRRQRSLLGGWPIVGWSALVLAVMGVAILATQGVSEAGLRTLVRATAKTSLLLFTSAFIASALNRLWRTPLSRWMLMNRRYLGVSFAVSHFLHLAAILLLASTLGTKFTIPATTLVGGGFGYVLIAAMTATSFDRTAAAIGPRAWAALHTTGVYYIWFIFLATYLPQAIHSLSYLVFPVVLVAAIALRLLARLQRRPRLGAK